MNNQNYLPQTLEELDMDTKQLSQRVKSANQKAILSIFQSDNFTPELLIHYFMATFNEPGPHQYLTNRLYHMQIKFVEYYIPQFVYMVIKIGSSSMETFLEYLCSRSIANYFKINWCLNSYSQSEKSQDKVYQKIEQFQRRLEKAMINGSITFSKEEIQKNLQNQQFQEKLIKQYQEKECRTQYSMLLERFILLMIQLSLTLKQVQSNQRKQFLLDYIAKGNKAIQRMRQKQPNIPYFWGIIIPFERNHDLEEPSNLIVNICTEGAACFNTKTRVPYRIIVETVSIKELEEKLELIKSKYNNEENGDEEDLTELPPITNLEEIMKEIAHEKQADSNYKQLVKYHSQSSSCKNLDDLEEQQQIINQQRSTSWSDTESPTKQSQYSQDSNQFQKEWSSQKALSPLKDLSPLKGKEGSGSSKCVQQYKDPWGEDWNNKFIRIRESSKYNDFDSLKQRVIMIKGGDDLRQELLAMQVIQKMYEIFSSAQLNIFLKPYEIIVTSENSGILEFVQNTISMDALKKYLKKQKKTLVQFYKEKFENDYQKAQKNFVESLAGYSLLCYILQVKDRHNGNILIDNQGHLIHIDFGFILSISPGNMGFERAPFKLTQDYLDIMNGKDSSMFEYFRRLMQSGYLELRKYSASILQLIEIIMEKSNFNCFTYFNYEEFKKRFLLQESVSKCKQHIEQIIQQSLLDSHTGYYDGFQYMTNGIYP